MARHANDSVATLNGHDFHVVTLKRPTWCKLDNDLIYGIVRQGAKCRYCGMIVHRRCVNSLSSSECEAKAKPPSADEEQTLTPTQSNKSTDESSTENELLVPLRPVHPGLSMKNRLTAVLREGWLSYRTGSDRSSQKLHFWKITAKELAIFDSPIDRFATIKIPIDSVLAVEENGEDAYEMMMASLKHDDVETEASMVKTPPPIPGIGGEYPHVFTIRTPRVVIYAGQDPSFFEKTSDWNELNKGIGRAYGLGWMNTIRQLCFALPGANSQDVDIRTLYDVDPDDPNSVIGSGQFGIVYGARMKPPGDGQVAIKAIDKKHLENLDKLSLNQFLASEIRIMKEMSHPGITQLIECINTAEKIYIVMEKAHTDMLDFITSHPNSRLSERTTKFLTKQILVALRYLHTAHKMAHCDLKPENVLLVFNNEAKGSEFPLVKLADFGYSRIIGDHSFRASVVGTPAYLPPEVLTKAPLFNKELDSWSVGVVVFVSLSGVFPYNSDDEEAVLRLQKTPIAFPDDPWKKLSAEAVPFVRHLMEVNMRQRASPNKALRHPWLAADYQAWCDIRTLDAWLASSKNSIRTSLSASNKVSMESAVSSPILEWTSVEEEKQWEAYRLAHGLPHWQQCGCK